MNKKLLTLAFTLGTSWMAFAEPAARQPVEPCDRGPGACTAQYDPAICTIRLTATGKIAKRVKGSNSCVAVETFRDKQCEAHKVNPAKYADASAFDSQCAKGK